MEKIISFDLDGTIIDPTFLDLVWDYGVPQLYAQKHGMSFHRAKALVHEEYRKVGEGRIEWYDIKYWFKYFQLDQDWRDLFYRLKDAIKVYPDALQTLEKLARSHQLVITSNATREFIDVEMEVSGLKDLFVRIFSATSDFQLVKKTPEFYSMICNLLEVKPEEMTHIGDHWDFDYVIPRSLGITTFYLDRKGEKQGNFVLRDLRELENKLVVGTR